MITIVGYSIRLNPDLSISEITPEGCPEAIATRLIRAAEEMARIEAELHAMVARGGSVDTSGT